MATDQPTPTPVVPVLAPIQMPSPLGGPSAPFQPHGALCAAFAEMTASYLAELGTLTNDMRALAAAIPSVTRHDPRQRLHAEKLAERYAQLHAQFRRLVALATNLRGELNSWLYAAALACPDCGAALPTQPWPLPDLQVSQTSGVAAPPPAGEPDLLSGVLRRELRQRRRVQN